MKQFLLLMSQKNKIFKCVEEAGLNPLNFEWEEEKTEYYSENYLVSVIRYIKTDFYFKFDRDTRGGFICKFYPGEHGLPQRLSLAAEWNVALENIRRWLSYLREEVGPDPWEELKKYTPREAIGDTTEISNTTFSDLEVEEVKDALDKLQAQIEKNFNLQGEQVEFVRNEIKFLKEQVKSQGRKAWRYTLYGAILSIAMNLMLSSDKAALLWNLAKSCFGALLRLPAP